MNSLSIRSKIWRQPRKRLYCTYLTKLTRASGNAIANSRLYSGPFRLLFCRMSFAKYIMASFFFGFTVTRICKFKTTKKRSYYVSALLFFNFYEEKKYIPSNDRKNKDNQGYLLNTMEKQYTMEKHKNLCSNRSHLSLVTACRDISPPTHYKTLTDIYFDLMNS